MRKHSLYVISENATLKEAMEIITHNHRGSVVVVDQERHVVGVVADGEIRRALLMGAIHSTPVKKVVNVNFISVSSGDEITRKNPQDFFSKHGNIEIAPIIDNKNKLVDVIVHNEADL